MTFHQKSATSVRSASRKLVSVVPPPNSQLQALPPTSSPPQEDSFWNTPATTVKTLRFTDNILDTAESLLNEQIHLGDISSFSSSSPVPPSWTARGSPSIHQDNSPHFTASDSNSSSEVHTAQEENVDNFKAEKVEDEETVVVTESRTLPLTSSMQNLVSVIPHKVGVQKPGLRVNSEVERIVV